MSGTLKRKQLPGSSTGPRTGPGSVTKGRPGSNENVKVESPKKLVPKGVSLKQKIKIVERLEANNEAGTWTNADFLTLKELACDPDNFNFNISTEDDEDEAADNSSDVLTDFELGSHGVHLTRRVLDFQEEQGASATLEEEKLPQVIKDFQAFRETDKTFWNVMEQGYGLRSKEREMGIMKLIGELMTELQCNVLPSLNKILKKPIAPQELAKAEGSGIRCNVEDQTDFIETVTSLSSAVEQLSQIDATKINLQAEIKALAQKITYLETQVTEQTVERINFQKLKSYLEQLSADRTPKSE